MNSYKNRRPKTTENIEWLDLTLQVQNHYRYNYQFENYILKLMFNNALSKVGFQQK